MPNPNETPIEQPTAIQLPQFQEESKSHTRLYIIITTSFALVILLFLIFYLTPSCKINPKINQTYLSIMNKTETEINSFCKTSDSQETCLAKFYYTYTNSGNIPQAQRVWLFKEAQENIQGMAYTGKTEHICSWK